MNDVRYFPKFKMNDEKFPIHSKGISFIAQRNNTI